MFFASAKKFLVKVGPRSEAKSSCSSSAQSAGEKSFVPFILAMNLLKRPIELNLS
jgi:hypothetical protein